MTTPTTPSTSSAPATPAATATPSIKPGGPAPVTPTRDAPKAPAAASAKAGALTNPNAAAPTEAAPTPAEPKPTPAAPAQPEKRKYKLKVDGQEIEEELGDEEISVRLQKARAAEKRMQEAAEVKKQWAQLKEIAKQDPSVLLKEIAGIEDPVKWAEERVAEKWKMEVMPEAERKQLETQRELETYKRQVAEYQAQQRAAQEAQQLAALEAQTEASFKQAFEVSGLEWSPQNLELFGKVALEALDYGIDLTPAQMAAEVKAQIERTERESTEKAKGKILGLKGDDLLSALGDEVVKEVLRASVAKHKSATQSPTFAAPAATPEPENRPKFNTMADWRKHFKGR